LDSHEANRILELDLALDASLHLGSSNHELSFFVFFFGLNQLIFLPKWWHVGLALICHFLVFNLHRKFMGPFYGDQPIGFHWTLDLGSSSKVALSLRQLIKLSIHDENN
jgi:hypothetical protein